jgi:hypothetical protein
MKYRGHCMKVVKLRQKCLIWQSQFLLSMSPKLNGCYLSSQPQLTQKNELTDQKSVCDCQKGNTKVSPIHFVSAVHRLSSLP